MLFAEDVDGSDQASTLLMFPLILVSPLLLASPDVQVVSFAAVGSAVDVFLPLVLRPSSPCYGSSFCCCCLSFYC
jgi:hypothetical protein